MILLWLIVVLLAGGVFAWLAARSNPLLCRWISLAAISRDFVLVLGLAVRNFKVSGIEVSVTGPNIWFEQVDLSWIPQFGIHFHLAMDGLSLLLMMLIAIALYFAHYRGTGVYTFEYADLLHTTLDPHTAMWIMLGFFIAFAVKLPMGPFHTWLADAHTEAPTAGSIILAGLLLKTGAYGLIRFVVPLFPGAAREFAPVAMTLAVVGILYGAILAFGQTDLKRLVAYTSISHLGFVLLGVFAANSLALQGALMTMICNGISRLQPHGADDAQPR